MKKELNKLAKEELITLVWNHRANIKRISKLYLKAKTELDYLQRRNKIVENRLRHLKEMWEMKNGCKLKFERIDAHIRKEKKTEKKIKIEFEDNKNGNAKDERV